MLTFLFWNMGGELPETTRPRVIRERNNRLLGILRNLTQLHDVDLLIIAESPLSAADVLTSVNHHLDARQFFREPDPRSLCERIKVYARFPTRYISRCDESPYFTGRRITLPVRERFLLYVVHFPSKLYQGDESQSQEMPVFSGAIRQREKDEKHSRTIVVGDFNMNPFETGMVSAQGLNAVMTREVAQAGSRRIVGVDHPFFYNPMWGHFGDSTHELHPPGSAEHKPAGTCFYSSSESVWYFWNMLDQVLLRPSLMDRFRNSDLKILTSDGVSSFLNDNGRPDRMRISDHLPLLFRISL
jgi:hypothetical protein